MSGLQFRVAARTDAAGKYNASAPLEGNEDNMFLDADLSNFAQGEFMADEVVALSDKGCLMVVADGMGGMNAGEVASAIAIKTVMEYFDNEHMKDKTFRDARSRMNYMEDVVIAADTAIKADSRTNKEHEGMGSTIIMAWLCDGEICLTWCGDSRAYLYRPECGFWQVSKDHSYVQGLVDEGKITIEEAFDHPYGNIITRSLGDPEKKAKPESINFDVYEGDIFMLCSDGLSGVLRDHKTFVDGQRIDMENLEDIIVANRTSMAQCRDELFDAAQRNDWYDNVTAILCEIVKGDALPDELKKPVQYSAQKGYERSVPNPIHANNIQGSRISISKKNLPIIISVVVLLLGAIGILSWKLFKPEKYNLQADRSMFEKCLTGDDYRAYMKKYPEGVGNYFELAKNRLAEWVADSTKKAIAEANLKEAPNNSKSQTIENTKKSDVSDDKRISKEKISIEDDGYRGDVDHNPFIDKKTEGDSPGLTPNNPNSGLKPNDPNQGLKLNDPNQGLKIGGGLTKTKSALPSSEEEAYMRAIGGGLEDCLYWMDTYGDSKTRDEGHWNNVRQVFVRLYKEKAKLCKTIEECKDFISEHDGIMRKSRMRGTDQDGKILRIVQDKLSELEKGEKSATTATRPAQGIQNISIKAPGKKM